VTVSVTADMRADIALTDHFSAKPLVVAVPVEMLEQVLLRIFSMRDWATMAAIAA